MEFNFPNIDWECHCTDDFDWVEYVKWVQECFLGQSRECPIRKRAKLDLQLVNWVGQVTNTSVDEHFGVQ